MVRSTCCPGLCLFAPQFLTLVVFQLDTHGHKLMAAVSNLESVTTPAIPSTPQPRNNFDFGRTLRMPSPRNMQTDEAELDLRVQVLLSRLADMHARVGEAQVALSLRREEEQSTGRSSKRQALATNALVVALDNVAVLLPSCDTIASFFQDSNHQQPASHQSSASTLGGPHSDSALSLGISGKTDLTAASEGTSGVVVAPVWHYLSSHIVDQLDGNMAVLQQAVDKVELQREELAALEQLVTGAVTAQRALVQSGLQSALTDLEDAKFECVFGRDCVFWCWLSVRASSVMTVFLFCRYEVAKRQANGDPELEEKLKQAKTALDAAAAAVQRATALDAELLEGGAATPEELLSVVAAVAEALAAVPLATAAVTTASGKEPSATILRAAPRTVQEAQTRLKEASATVVAMRERLVELTAKANAGDDAARAAAHVLRTAVAAAEKELAECATACAGFDPARPKQAALLIRRMATTASKVEMVMASADSIQRAVAPGAFPEGNLVVSSPSGRWGRMPVQEANALKRFNAASKSFAKALAAAKARATSDDSRDALSLAVQDAIVQVEERMKEAAAARTRARRASGADGTSADTQGGLNAFTIAVADVVMSLGNLEQVLEEAQQADRTKAAARKARADAALERESAKAAAAGAGGAGAGAGAGSAPGGGRTDTGTRASPVPRHPPALPPAHSNLAMLQTSSVRALVDRPMALRHSTSPNGGRGRASRSMSQTVNALVGLPTFAMLIRAKNRMRYGKEFAGLVARLKVAGKTYDKLIKTLRAAQMDKLPLEVGLPLREKLKQSTTSLRIADLSIPTPAERALNPPTIDNIMKFETKVRAASMRVAAFEQALGKSMEQLDEIAAAEARKRMHREKRRREKEEWLRSGNTVQRPALCFVALPCLCSFQCGRGLHTENVRPETG